MLLAGGAVTTGRHRSALAGKSAGFSSFPVQLSETGAPGFLPAGLVHDFNNLLTVINGYNAMLLTWCELPEKARQCLTLARSAGERAATLARSMMDLSRQTARAPQVIDVNELVREFVAVALYLLPANVELSAVLAADLRPVLADPCGVLQVLLNLVVNSRDAMPEGGKVEIQTASIYPDTPVSASHPYLPRGNYILLSVRDNGIGMDDATRQRIFEPFYTTKAGGSGRGLGLPMVQRIVKQNSGFLSVETAKGQGTTVRIYLPAAQASPAAGNTEITASAGLPSGARETILIVEGDAELRNLIRETLEHLGYSVLDAGSAAEAAELSAGLRDRVDLLVAELVLPDSTARELAACLRESRRDLPVLYISGDPLLVSVNDPSQPDVLAKPFSPTEFGDNVRSILDRRSRKRVLFVDDDDQIVMFASEVLRDAGYEVLVGADGNVALSIVDSEPLDLVITDLVMREREGLETMMRLKKSHPQLPVVAISGAFGGHFLRSAVLLGVRATLAKPFSSEDLLNVVRMVLGS
jgi:two-component system, cell cycle sensor histidine kinase and response regulator CckA